MSAAIDHELMVLVERIVRPLPVSLKRQKRLRAEFLEHLRATYSEELARDGDPRMAWARTQERFGDPAELTEELRSTLRWWEPWEAWLERSLAQRPTETPLRYVGRMVGGMLLFLAMMFGLTMLDHHFFGTERITLLKVKLSLAMIISLALWVGGFLVFSLHVGAEWHRPHRRWSRIIPLSLGLIATWPMSLAVLFCLASGFSWISDPHPVLSGSILAGLLSVIGGMAVGILHHRETRYRHEWAALDLDAA